MKYTVPDYYHEFQCIAGECPATCCAGWQIVIDERSLKRYQKYKGSFGNRLANSINWEEGIFHQYNGRCAFLDENNLCDIYTEAGSHMFCRTCRNYPRHIEEFENEREISLSLSCPVAAELILGRKDKVTFLTAEKESKEEEYEDFDFFLYSALQDCRSVMIEILQDRKQPIRFRMAKVLALAHDVQNRMNARRIFEVETLLERYQRTGADEKLKAKFSLYQKDGEEMTKEKKLSHPVTRGAMQQKLALLGLLDELEVLDPSWTMQLKSWSNILLQEAEKAGSGMIRSQDTAKEKVCKDDRNLAGKKRQTDMDMELEQLMVYFIFTYFAGAVYDGDALAKVKMAVTCTLMLRYLWMADRMLEQRLDKGYGQSTEEKQHMETKRNAGDKLCSSRNRVAWRFSRELEHSDLNLDKMEFMMNEREEASFEALLKLIFAG